MSYNQLLKEIGTRFFNPFLEEKKLLKKEKDLLLYSLYKEDIAKAGLFRLHTYAGVDFLHIYTGIKMMTESAVSCKALAVMTGNDSFIRGGASKLNAAVDTSLKILKYKGALTMSNRISGKIQGMKNFMYSIR